MEDYSKLLKDVKKKLPENSLSKERFEIPTVKGHIEGNKTILNNYNQILSALQRDGKMLLKFLQKELATPAKVESGRLVLGRKIGSGLINKKISQFAKDFVICKECGRPDTQLIKEDRILFKKCTACGAKHPVKVKI